MVLSDVDPEVAAATFAADLDRLWANDRPRQLGWRRTRLDAVTEIIEMFGRRLDGGRDPYHVRLDASRYGPHPPNATFVEPNSWTEAPGDSRWFPRLEDLPGWFGLHATYTYPDNTVRQLVCFSHNLDYYKSNHTPQPTEVWTQSRHTVAATIYRLHEVLGPAYYRGPMALLEEAA